MSRQRKARLGAPGGPYGSGPWPGLTPRGALVLLGCAALLGVLLGLLDALLVSPGAGTGSSRGAWPELVSLSLLVSPGAGTGSSRGAWPELVPLSLLSFAPLALAARVVCMPGAASAVVGAYLLPRTLLSLADPVIPLPPLLLVPVLVFDTVAWLRVADLRALRDAWPRSTRRWSARRDRAPRLLTPTRLALAGAAFGLTLGVVEPPYQLVLGASQSLWSPPETWLAAGVSAAACALLGAALSVQWPR